MLNFSVENRGDFVWFWLLLTRFAVLRQLKINIYSS